LKIKDELLLKQFDTGLFKASKLTVYGKSANLEIELHRLENETLNFDNVYSFRFTPLCACDLNMIDAYFKVVSIDGSKELRELSSKLLKAGHLNTQLKHLRIFLDEEGCYDFLAESVS
jgi:hypothetical protein|tara:strand:- start:4484 stop:4837 length:354 start_codon:yes stop_codon:yes gene_type:complete